MRKGMLNTDLFGDRALLRQRRLTSQKTLFSSVKSWPRRQRFSSSSRTRQTRVFARTPKLERCFGDRFPTTAPSSFCSPPSSFLKSELKEATLCFLRWRLQRAVQKPSSSSFVLLQLLLHGHSGAFLQLFVHARQMRGLAVNQSGSKTCSALTQRHCLPMYESLS